MAGGSERDQWLSAEELHQWKALMALVTILPGRLDAQLKRDAGMNLFEYHVLVALSEAPHHLLVMSDLAAHSKGSLSRLSHAVSRLESAGWVRRQSCGGAGRRTQAHLTPAGMKHLERIAPGHVKEARRLVVDVLSARELADLGAAARRIVAEADPDVAPSLQEGQSGSGISRGNR